MATDDIAGGGAWKAELREWIEGVLRSGFCPIGQARLDAADTFAAEGDEAEVAAVVDAALAEIVPRLRAEQAAWPPETDCDRLDAAFVELDRAGVLARHHLGVDQGDGGDLVREEIRSARARGVRPRGVVFYHMQDTDRAVAEGELYLAFGTVGGGDEDAVAVGREIVAALARHGLAADWPGRFDTRIRVPLDWKRRLPEG